MTEPTYKERVFADHERVTEDAARLKTFIDSDAFITVDPHERRLMIDQLVHMVGYRNALQQRMAMWKTLQSVAGATHVMQNGVLTDFDTGKPVSEAMRTGQGFA